MRRILIIAVAIVGLIIIALQLGVFGLFSVTEPEAVPAVDDALEQAPVEERGGISDGGPLTSQPNQSMPESEETVEEPADAPDAVPEPQ